MYLYFRKDTRQFSHSSVDVNGGDWLLEFNRPAAKPMHAYILGDDDEITEGAQIISTGPGITPEAFNLHALRVTRDAKLAATDWMAMSDRVMTPKQRAYRQALRDITLTASRVQDAVWPALEQA